MKDKHTPGPWTIDEFGYINAGGQQIADVHVYDSSNCMDCGQCEGHSVRNEPKLPYQANARLMAAAPELLEALRLLMEFSSGIGSHYSIAYSIAEKLIAKIEGDESNT